MRQSRACWSPSMLAGLALMVTLGLAGPAAAQDKPLAGGELIFVVAAEPPSFDAHREETFAMLHPTAPHYNTLLRVDPNDKTGTRFIGDLAESPPPGQGPGVDADAEPLLEPAARHGLAQRIAATRRTEP